MQPEPEPAGGGGGGPDPRMKALRAEVDKIRAKWGDQITMVKGGQKGNPWPVTVTRTIPRPANAADWDIHEIIVSMVVDHPDMSQALVHIDVPMDNLPPKLRAKIAEAVERKWKATLKDPRAAGKGWLFGMILLDCEKKWLTLISLLPEYIDKYQDVHPDGSTYRRSTITTTVRAPAPAGRARPPPLNISPS